MSLRCLSAGVPDLEAVSVEHSSAQPRQRPFAGVRALLVFVRQLFFRRPPSTRPQMRAKRARAIRAPGARIWPHRRGRRDVTEHRCDQRGGRPERSHPPRGATPAQGTRAASRIKPETVIATAKASKYRLTPPRAAAGTTLSVAKAPSWASRNGKATPAKACRAPGALAPTDCITRARGIAGASPHAGAHEGLASTNPAAAVLRGPPAPHQPGCDVRCPQDVGSRDGRDISEAPRAIREFARPAADVKRDECVHVPQGAAVPKRRSRCLTSSPRPRSQLRMSGQSLDICEPDFGPARAYMPGTAVLLRRLFCAPSGSGERLHWPRGLSTSVAGNSGRRDFAHRFVHWTARWTVRWTVFVSQRAVSGGS
jgi:hypothetical protein